MLYFPFSKTTPNYMTLVWTFEGGYLTARNKTGRLLWGWLADEVMGRPLADLLNHAPALSRLLLTPWAMSVPAEPA